VRCRIEEATTTTAWLRLQRRFDIFAQEGEECRSLS
jgi:hypothetical protein